MTIRDYDRDMILGQKYAVECEYRLRDSDDEASTWETYHFQIGSGRPNPFYDDTVDFFRVSSDEIYFHVHRVIDDLEEITPSDRFEEIDNWVKNVARKKSKRKSMS